MKEINPNYGLQPTPVDERDYQLGAITFLPDLHLLPQEYKIEATIRNQLGSDFCSAYMSCVMSEAQEGVVFEPAWSFAVSKQLSGDIHGWGQNIRDALKAHVKFGAAPVDTVEMNVENETPEVLRDIGNWPDVTTEARQFKKKTFFRITGQYDHFDNARAALWKYQTPIGVGVNFGWPLSQQLLDNIPTGGFGHAVAIVGFTMYETGEPVLIVQNSYGTGAGDQGYHYITRKVYNAFAEKYGQWMFVDLPPEDAKWYVQNNIRLEDNWLTQLWKILVNTIRFWK